MKFTMNLVTNYFEKQKTNRYKFGNQLRQFSSMRSIITNLDFYYNEISFRCHHLTQTKIINL